MFGFGKKKVSDKPTGRSKFAMQLMELLDCPCEYFAEGTNPDVILSAYNTAFAKREMGGYTPLIIAIDATLMEEVGDIAKTSEELKANRKKMLNSPSINGREWFVKTLTELKNELGDSWKETFGEFAGEPTDISKNFSGFINYSTNKSDECILAKIPVTNPWEVFAWLPFGGWNACPQPEEVLWIAKYWYEQYGVYPAVMTRDVLEFSAHPIRDEKTAMAAALEHYAFCSDIVDQGVGTIGRLARSLTQSSVWYFWWD